MNKTKRTSKRVLTLKTKKEMAADLVGFVTPETWHKLCDLVIADPAVELIVKTAAERALKKVGSEEVERAMERLGWR